MRYRKVVAVAGMALFASALAAIVVTERKRPLRRPKKAEPKRSIVNIALGVGAMTAVALVEQPLTRSLSKRISRNGRHPFQKLPRLLGDLSAFLLLDYSTYLWHVATHKVPLLWRFHLVHHIDRDLDSSTALRFHVVDMLVSTPIRLFQVALSGARPEVLELWRRWFFLNVLFHHSNVRLPGDVEQILSRIMTTPRMHGIHHSAVRDETDSNWSSGLAIWDHLHRTFRLDVRQDEIAIGVPGYRTRDATGLNASLRLPFVHQHDVWDRQGTPVGLVRSLGHIEEISHESRTSAARTIE